MDPLTSKYHKLLLGTAIYNWFVGISMLKPKGCYEAFNITPIPNEDNTLHICSMFIFGFGFNYYYASQNVIENDHYVTMGITYKAVNLVIAVFDIFVLEVVTWQYLLLLAPDAILVIIFYKMLQGVKEYKLKHNGGQNKLN